VSVTTSNSINELIPALPAGATLKGLGPTSNNIGDKILTKPGDITGLSYQDPFLGRVYYVSQNFWFWYAIDGSNQGGLVDASDPNYNYLYNGIAPAVKTRTQTKNISSDKSQDSGVLHNAERRAKQFQFLQQRLARVLKPSWVRAFTG
jgi:hypothetical protein